jgi:hypothetical protein
MDGRRRACMNNLKHGMRSTQTILPGECQLDYDERKAKLMAALNPRDAVAELLAERIVETAWLIRRGEGVAHDRATKTILDTVEGAADREAKRVDLLAPKIDDDPDAIRQLRTFPAGVAFLWDEWTVLYEHLSMGLSLLDSQRRRCFSLIGKTRESVFRDDRQATILVRLQLGVMYGTEATPEEVAFFLGGVPPEWMSQTEFDIRVKRLSRSLLPKAEAQERFKAYVEEKINELAAHSEVVDDVADRKLASDASIARVAGSADEQVLWRYIQSNDRGCMAALRRLEIRQKPDGPGPKRGSKKPEAPAATSDFAAARPEAELKPEPDAPGLVPAAVADEVWSEDVAAAIPTTEADEPNAEGDESSSTAEADADFFTVEPILEAKSAEAGADLLTVEPILEVKSAEAGADLLTVEPILEAKSGEAGANLFAVEPILDHRAEDDLERFGPQAAHLRELRDFFKANSGAGGGIGGPGAELEPRENPVKKAEERLRLRQEELSRQLDAHFGINGERPEPVQPAPVADGAGDRATNARDVPAPEPVPRPPPTPALQGGEAVRGG